mgnify:CR=1 FL=1
MMVPCEYILHNMAYGVDAMQELGIESACAQTLLKNREHVCIQLQSGDLCTNSLQTCRHQRALHFDHQTQF